MQIKGNKYGTHRVISQTGVLTQAAEKIDSSMEKKYSNEIICDVTSLNIDSASFTQIKNECGGDVEKIKLKIFEIVQNHGKMQNPVTGSGGMFIGTVSYIGEDLQSKIGLKLGDRVASLVSLSLTPLKIQRIKSVCLKTDRVDIEGQAVLFESGIYAILPKDLPENLALAALDVAGAAAQTARLVQSGDSVLVLGAAGKSGVLVCYEAKKRAGPTGRVVGVVICEKDALKLKSLNVVNEVVVASATQPISVLNETLAVNGCKEYDVSINCVNVENTEMASILPVRDGGTVYFFSMATSFTKAALGAEGVGKDITMIIGNGYTKGHAEITLNELRESPALRKLFEETYS